MRAAILLLFVLTACEADTIVLNSGISAGGSNSGTGASVLITPHPVWAPSDAKWISYDNTGYQGIVVPSSMESPAASFYQDFYMTADTNRAVGDITVWADDTASVFLDGVLLFSRSLNLGSGCTADGIGCLPGHGVELAFDILGDFGSKHTLQFDVFQQWGGPFGLMYSGTIELSDPPVSETPEPASFGVIAAMLAGGAMVVRKRNASASK